MLLVASLLPAPAVSCGSAASRVLHVAASTAACGIPSGIGMLLILLTIASSCWLLDLLAFLNDVST